MDVRVRRPSVASIGVVMSNNRVLLVRRKNEPDAGLWGFPGGHIETGETGLAAAQREVFEETSIVCKSICYLTNVDVIVRSSDRVVSQHFLLAAVLCVYLSGDPSPADDVSDARWVPFADVFERRLDCSEHVDTVLKQAVRQRLQNQI